MYLIIKVFILRKEIYKSLECLKHEKTILYPTDTVWGIGCDATNEKAVAKIYELKNRAETKSLIVLVSSLNMLKKYVKVPSNIIGFIKSTTKPTTIIYENPTGFAKNTIAADNTIAIRIVQDAFCRKLIKSFKKPIVSTSANLSGEATPKSFSEISDSILNGVDYVVQLKQDVISNKSSTIVKVIDKQFEILRA